ncbi:MAG: trypsin-like peptidase domain-containing protein [Candidatus Caldarchaeum sp.]
MFCRMVVVWVALLSFCALSAQNSPQRRAIVDRAQAATVWILTDAGMGSGFVVSSDGYIVTNRHVIEDALEVAVFVGNRKRYLAKVIEKSNDADLAILKIEPEEPLVTLELGDSSALRPGDPVFSVGYPIPTNFLYAGIAPYASVSFGVVSGIRRPLTGRMVGAQELIHHDARIASGNSGGPLVSADTGQVVGVNTLGFTPRENAAGDGQNFAVPSNIVLALLANSGVNPKHRSDIPPNLNTGASARMSDLLIISPAKEISPLWVNFMRLPNRFNADQLRNIGFFQAATGQLPSLVSEAAVSPKGIWLTSIDGQVHFIADTFYETDAVKNVLYDETRTFFYPPVVSGNTVFVWSGRLGFSASIVPRTDLMGLMVGGFRSKAVVSGISTLYCIDQQTRAVRWSQELTFVSHVIIRDNELFYGGLGGYGCLDKQTGAYRWTIGGGAQEEHPKWYIPARATSDSLILLEVPLRVSVKPEDLEEDDIIAVFGNGVARLIIADPQNGKVKKRIDLGNVDNFRRAMSASVDFDPTNSIAVCVIGPYITAVDLSSGKRLWSFTAATLDEIRRNRGRGAPIFQPKVIVTQDTVIAGNTDQNLYALGLRDGTQKWTYRTRGTVGAPALHQGDILFGSGDGYIYCVDIASGQLEWRVKTEVTVLAKPTIVDGFCIFSASRAQAVFRIFLSEVNQ